MAKLFFSYSHADENLRNKLETHLASLKHLGYLETWHDRCILAGAEIDGEILDNLDDADIILLLISSDFIASKYCYDVEVQHALTKHHNKKAVVIPVILRACDWHEAPFGKLLAAPKDGKPIVLWTDQDEAFLDIVKQIKAVVTDLHGKPSVLKPTMEAQALSMGSFPRSSNLALKAEFTEMDIDDFLETAFSFISNYFFNSLNELEKRNPDISTRHKELTANSFTAVIYKRGTPLSKCKITLGGMFSKAISYSNDDNPSSNSCNEYLSCVNDSDGIYFSASGMMFPLGNETNTRMSPLAAAEHFWDVFFQPLK